MFVELAFTESHLNLIKLSLKLALITNYCREEEHFYFSQMKIFATGGSGNGAFVIFSDCGWRLWVSSLLGPKVQTPIHSCCQPNPIIKVRLWSDS